ncbi:helix-turn-helix domain-containing protein [Cytobacillus spongiae]|uniref:PucR family transcriptional regulator n=1 Tax=Cytobacillus spongiae TaxID=2901381 RepID=UPI001F36C6CA|nr:helix-turn-helix domain-containing protein [Cytobacillus spongiae]UII56850.1 helix-turn-helix domain-containing protein [Cytobacillus spongiae]
MLKLLQNLYEKSIFKQNKPDLSSNYHWFYESASGDWLGIPSTQISEKELTILKTLYHYHEIFSTHDPISQQWYDFLFADGNLPLSSTTGSARLSLFYCEKDEWDKQDLESALKGSFPESPVILWENDYLGVIIEQSKDLLNVDEFESIAQTFETDFYKKIYFFIGKSSNITEELADTFTEEKAYFTKGMRLLPQQRVQTFEKLFPIYIVSEYNQNLQSGPIFALFQSFKEDPDLHLTLKIYLENHSNASTTAKKLYIHRNTLQYRLDKFTEKTGVQLKDFNSAVTVYLACLMYDLPSTSNVAQ